MKIHELTLHKDPRIFNLNELDYRSYFIPFESEEATLKSRENSAYYTSLCGEWLFRYADSAFDMPDFVSSGAAPLALAIFARGLPKGDRNAV